MIDRVTTERYDWYLVTGLTVERDDVGRASVLASLTLAEFRSGAGAGERVLEVQAWGSDASEAKDVLAEGFEVWAGIDAEKDYVALWSAFDADGRVAGVGEVAADYFTVPVAERAAMADASSAFAYLEPLLAK